MGQSVRVPLLSGAYQNRSIIAGAQRSVNLFSERNSQESQSPVPVTHYPTAGKVLVAEAPLNNVAVVRGLYRANNGDLYAVIGKTAYFIDNNLTFTTLGVVSDLQTPVSFSDNGLVVVLVDGTATGYAIDPVAHVMAVITDPVFYGADRADYVDTYFIFNRPATTQFYISLSNITYDMLTGTAGAIYNYVKTSGGTGYTNGVYPNSPLTGGTGVGATANITVAGGIVTVATLNNPGSDYTNGDVLGSASIGAGAGFTFDVVNVHGQAFDPLDIVAKSGSADNIASVICNHRNIWLIGDLTTEVWYNSGAADFTFQALPGAFIEHGCIAKYSVAAQDVDVFWLSQDRQGKGIVIQGTGYTASRISTHAIEAVFQSYATISDAIGFCYQQQGHAFYVLTFPSANATWAVELATGEWHELASSDQNGKLNRDRANCCTFAYQMNLVGDWQNGRIYRLDPDVYTENGNPIIRIRTFPHLLDAGNRVVWDQFIADLQVGTLPGVLTANPPMVTLRVSLDRGASYGNGLMQSMGAGGEYLTSVSFWRLGMGRDVIFELSWSAPVRTALNGAFVRQRAAES